MGNTESLASGSVTKLVSKSDYVKPNIPENSSEPAWDGYIDYYNSKNKAKTDSFERIRIQVKGRTVKKISSKELKFPININDLNTYLNYGGTIYFVVQIEKYTLESKVFYSSLLPLKIKHLINSSSGKKTINTKLYEFPEKPEHIDQVFSSFLSHKHRQFVPSSTELPTLETLAGIGKIEKISLGISGYGFDSNQPELNLLQSNSEIYTYAKIKGLDLSFPLEMIPATHRVVFKTVHAPVIVNGQEFYNQYEYIYEVEQDTIKIGDCLCIKTNKKSNNIKMTFQVAKQLQMAICSLDFYFAMFESKSLSINNVTFELVFSESDSHNTYIQHLRLIQSHYKNIDELFKTLNVNRSIPLDEITDIEHNTLESLAAGFLRHVPLIINEDVQTPIRKVKIGKYYLLLMFSLISNSPKNTYKVTDYFSSEHEFTWQSSDGSNVPAPIYMILRRDDYQHVLNIDYEKLVPSIIKYEPSNTDYGMANYTLLELLSAYDIEEQVSIWSCIKALDNWMMSKQHIGVGRATTLLNHYQIIKRERSLNENEVQDIYLLIESNSEQHHILFGAYLLLDQQEMAKKHLMQLSTQDQASFLSYPICHFIKFKL